MLSILSIVIPVLVGIILIIVIGLIIWWIWRRATGNIQKFRNSCMHALVKSNMNLFEFTQARIQNTR